MAECDPMTATTAREERLQVCVADYSVEGLLRALVGTS